jgi:hypothetical protein
MSLREEFEPHLISPHGCHSDHERWERCWHDIDEAEIERATAWLNPLRRTTRANPAAGSSYGLKHRASAWWERTRGGNGYICNGAFMMAAVRLGFKYKTIPGIYCNSLKPPLDRDCLNAWLNIAKQSRDSAA